MRLKNHMDTFVSTLPRSVEGGLDFRGMVPIIVDHGYAIGFAAHLEAAIDAAKIFETRTDLVRRNLQRDAHGNGCRGVQYVVPSRSIDSELTQRIGTMFNLKTGKRPVRLFG